MRILLLSIVLLSFVASAHAELTPPSEYIYSVRGIIKELPAEGSREISVRHEPIPNFVGFDGVVDPMPTMTMPFTLAEDVSLSGLSVGDEIEMRYEMRWKKPTRDVVTQIAKLSAGTVKFPK